MRRRILLENNTLNWQKQQKAAAPEKEVVFVLTKFNGEEVVYDDFWDAVFDAEDKYCVDANMINGYFRSTDEDGLTSLDPIFKVNDDAPYDGHWTEEEGTLSEPSISYKDYVAKTGLTEAGRFPSNMQGTSSWVARTPVQSRQQSQTTAPQQTPATSKTSTTAPSQTRPQPAAPAPKGAFTPKSIEPHERALLDKFSNAEDRVCYALELYVMFMDRLAPKYGLSLSTLSQLGPTDFFDVESNLFDLCSDVEDVGDWPSTTEWIANFEKCIGRAATTAERLFLREGLVELCQIADGGWSCVFKDAGDHFSLCASNWLDSDCGYDNYELAFELGFYGKQPEDWYDITGSGKDADYLDDTYYSGEASGAWFRKITK